MTNFNHAKKQLLNILLLVNMILLPYSFAFSQTSVIPAPAETRRGTGSFTLGNTTLISYPKDPAEVKWIADYLVAKLKPATGITFKTGTSGEKGIQFLLNKKEEAKLGKEGYDLRVTSSGITITANQPAGLFYGAQTLLQLLPNDIERKEPTKNNWSIQAVEIIDYPRFAWRGIMLDVSRHFFSKEYVKDYIDQLSRFKYNRLHLHLTDDNGWRVEIKSLPKLTSVGAWRVPRTGTFGSNEPPKPGERPTYGGFYSQDDIREIVAYAKERFIEILPEIDVPGHSMAVLAAYPELCVTKDTTIDVNPGTNFSTWYGNGKFTMHIDNTLNPADEKVYEFLNKVVAELAVLFPFEYIHMGGDECYKGYWEKDPKVQAFMKKNNIRNGEELQSYFTRRVSKVVTSHKKKMIGWDEILEGGIAADAAVMSWRGTKGGIEAAHFKHPVVMSPAPTYYLDMRQGELSVEPPVYGDARLKEVYHFSILPEGIDSAYVLGGQGNLWTEQIPTTAQVEYMTYPRALAIAETMWSPSSRKNWNNFVARVENQFTRFDYAGINYASSMYDPMITVKKSTGGTLLIELSTEVEGLDLFYTLDNTIPNQYYSRYKGPIEVPADVDNFRVVSYKNGKMAGRQISIPKDELVKRIKK